MMSLTLQISPYPPNLCASTKAHPEPNPWHQFSIHQLVWPHVFMVVPRRRSKVVLGLRTNILRSVKSIWNLCLWTNRTIAGMPSSRGFTRSCPLTMMGRKNSSPQWKVPFLPGYFAVCCIVCVVHCTADYSDSDIVGNRRDYEIGVMLILMTMMVLFENENFSKICWLEWFSQ